MLTDYIVEHAKPGPRAIRLSDARGLYLAVLPNGSKLWRLDFRFDGRRLTASFGPYPDISLEAARQANARARAMIRAGVNPIAEKRVALQTAKVARATTFGLVADELLEKLAREEKAPATVSKRAWLLKELAAPLADRPVNAITPVKILSVLQDVGGKGHLKTVRRLRASIGQVMRLAIATGRTHKNAPRASGSAIASSRRGIPPRTDIRGVGGSLAATPITRPDIGCWRLARVRRPAAKSGHLRTVLRVGVSG
jgi:hypothetical protein